VEAKVILLNEMLDNVDRERGEQFVAGDVYEVCSDLQAHVQRLIPFNAHSKSPLRYQPLRQRFKVGYQTQRRMIPIH